MTLNVLSLFAGIGGLELGLERAGMTTVGQVEIDPYCQRVLARHWPEVPRHDDVLTAPEWWTNSRCDYCPDAQGWYLERFSDNHATTCQRCGGRRVIKRPRVDVVCGGFPCQPFSLAGKQLGVNDERWMWPATAAAIRAVRPFYVLLENVSALVRDAVAFGAVLGDLHSLGFDAEWATLRAADFGAPTIRERVYVLAYPAGIDGESRGGLVAGRVGRAPIAARGLLGLDVAARRESAHAWLASEPDVVRLVDGVPDQSHRLRVAGNAVVPAVSEHIGRLIAADAAWRMERAA